MSKSNSLGTSLKVGTGNSQKTVGGITSISGIEISAEEIDLTALDNATGYREKEVGFKEVGNVSVSGFLDGADEGQTEMYSLLNSQTKTNFAIVFPTKIGKTWSFEGFVSGFTTGAEVGSGVTFEATIVVTGQATLAATASG